MRHPRQLSDDELRMIGRRAHALALRRGMTETEFLQLTASHPRFLNALVEATYIAVREQLEAELSTENGTRPQ